MDYSHGNICYVASAGSGKTSLLVQKLCERFNTNNIVYKRFAFITYTDNNQEEVKRRLCDKFGILPSNIFVIGWYKFLLQFWIRPFKGDVIPTLYDKQVSISLNQGDPRLIKFDIDGESHYRKGYSAGDLQRKYLTNSGDKLFTTNLAEFAMECYKRNKELLPIRLNLIFDSIYIDEAQDLVGYDFEILKVMSKLPTSVLYIAGDPRQRTYKTSTSTKHSDFSGRFDKFIETMINTRTKTYMNVDISTLQRSHRCREPICALASKITNSYLPTLSCDHDEETYDKPIGCFLVRKSDVSSFIDLYQPMTLTWEQTILVNEKVKARMNVGKSKGLQYDSVLIYPTKDVIIWINKNGKKSLRQETCAKFYVAVTRARYAVGIVVDDRFKKNRFIPFWELRTSSLFW